MIEGLENLRTLFGVFHDGDILLLAHGEGRLELAIEIPYLAKQIDPNCRAFILKMQGVRGFSFQPWLPADQAQREPVTDPERAFGFDLEVLSCEINADGLSIWCNADGDDFSCGGLALKADSAMLSDESGRECTLDEVLEIARGYWDDFSNRKN